MTEPLSPAALAQLRQAGLTRPKGTGPGRTWSPRTDAEQHLLREGYRLDRVRQLLLAEVGRLREGQAQRRERIKTAARTADRPSTCPLTPGQLDVLAGAAAGESPEDTARRLAVGYNAVRYHRHRAARRLGARNLMHAVALAVAAGWISRERVMGGVAP